MEILIDMVEENLRSIIENASIRFNDSSEKFLNFTETQFRLEKLYIFWGKNSYIVPVHA